MKKKAELPYNLDESTPLTYYRLILAIVVRFTLHRDNSQQILSA